MAVSLGHLAMFAIRSVRGLAHQRGHCDTLAWVASCCSDVLQEWCREDGKTEVGHRHLLERLDDLIFGALIHVHRP